MRDTPEAEEHLDMVVVNEGRGNVDAQILGGIKVKVVECESESVRVDFGTRVRVLLPTLCLRRV